MIFGVFFIFLLCSVLFQGVGLIKSYWLYGRDNFDGPLPNFGDLTSADHPKPDILPVTVGEDPKLSVCQDKADLDKSTVIKASNPEVQTLRTEKPIPKYSVKIGANTSLTNGEELKDLNRKDNNSASSKTIKSSPALSTPSDETTIASSSSTTQTATEKSPVKTVPSISLAAGTATENSLTKMASKISVGEDSGTEKLFKKVIRAVSPESPKVGHGAEKSAEKFAPATQKSPEKTVATTSTATACAFGEEHQEPDNSACATVVNVKPSSSSIQPSRINRDEHTGERESEMLPRSNLLNRVWSSEPAAKSRLERAIQPLDSKINKQTKATSANGTMEVKFNFRELGLREASNGLQNHQTTEFKFNLRDLGAGERQRAKTSLLTEEEARREAGKHRKKKLWRKSKSTELRPNNRVGTDSREFSSDNAAFVQDSEDNDTSTSSDPNTTTTTTTRQKEKNVTLDWAWDVNGSIRQQSDEDRKGNYDKQRRRHLSKSNERTTTARESYTTSDIPGKLTTHTSRKPNNENKHNSVMEVQRKNIPTDEDVNLNMIGAREEGADPVSKELLFYSLSPKSRLATKAPNPHDLTIPDVTVTDCVD